MDGRCACYSALRLDGWRDGFSKNTYLKLHGSVNWWLVNGKPTYLKWASYGDLAQKWKELEEGKTEDTPIILNVMRKIDSEPVKVLPVSNIPHHRLLRDSFKSVGLCLIASAVPVPARPYL